MRRKAFLFAALLILMAISITPAAAVGPPPTEEEYSVMFEGDITSVEVAMMGRRARGGKHLDLIDTSGASLTFVENEALWIYVSEDETYNWAGPHDGHLMFNIDLKTNEVEMTYSFDKDWQCVTVRKETICREVDTYSLHGSGGTYYNSSNVIVFEDVDFTMYNVTLVPSRGKGNTGYGLDFESITDELTLNFTVSVEPQTE